MSHYSIYNRGIQATNSSLYFIALDTGERLEIQFVPPIIEGDRVADLGTMKIVGRNNPMYQNVGGEDTLAITLDFYADEESRQSVIHKVRWLKSLTYTDGGRQPAQRVALVWGDLYKNEKWVVARVRERLSNFDAGYGFLPKQAMVDLQLKLAPDTNLTWEDVLPTYTEGEPDGQNPVQVNPPENSHSDEFVAATRGNSFEEMLRRTLERLRITS